MFIFKYFMDTEISGDKYETRLSMLMGLNLHEDEFFESYNAIFG